MPQLCFPSFSAGRKHGVDPGSDMVGVWKNFETLALTAILLMAGAQFGAAQVIRPGARPGAIPVRPRAAGDDDDSMTITLSGGAVNFNLVSGSATNPGNTSITVNLTWTCPCDTPTFDLYTYFTSSTAALTDGAGDNIPSSAFSISDNGGAFQPLTSTQPFGGANAGLHLVSIPGSSALFGGGHHTDVMNFNINLSTGTLPKLPPGAYTGTLTIQGQAQ